MAAETGFLIDEKLYDVPGLETFTMDEAQLLYDYSGLGLEDFMAPDEDETDDERRRREKALRNPGLLRALMHVAFQRGNPTMKPVRVRELIGKVNLVAAMEALGAGEEDDDASPPASTSEPEQSSPSEWPASSESSGGGSTNGSDPPDAQPTPTGTSRSDTPSTLAPTGSA